VLKVLEEVGEEQDFLVEVVEDKRLRHMEVFTLLILSEK